MFMLILFGAGMTAVAIDLNVTGVVLLIGALISMIFEIDLEES